MSLFMLKRKHGHFAVEDRKSSMFLPGIILKILCNDDQLIDRLGRLQSGIRAVFLEVPLLGEAASKSFPFCWRSLSRFRPLVPISNSATAARTSWTWSPVIQRGDESSIFFGQTYENRSSYQLFRAEWLLWVLRIYFRRLPYLALQFPPFYHPLRCRKDTISLLSKITIEIKKELIDLTSSCVQMGILGNWDRENAVF